MISSDAVNAEGGSVLPVDLNRTSDAVSARAAAVPRVETLRRLRRERDNWRRIAFNQRAMMDTSYHMNAMCVIGTSALGFVSGAGLVAFLWWTFA